MNKKRDLEIDLWRFFAAVFIMTHHLYNAGLDSSEYRFHDGHLFVEFFFLLTGYYMAKHFYSTGYADYTLEDKTNKALSYEWRRYKKLVVPCAVVTACEYIMYFTSSLSFSEKIKGMVGHLPDFLLISELFERPLVIPLWYVSAVIIVIPFVGLLMQLVDKRTLALFSWLIIGIYYGSVLPMFLTPAGMANTGGLEDLSRAFICLMAGTFIYAFSEWLSKKASRFLDNRIVFNILGEAILIVASLASYLGRAVGIYTMLSFMVALVLILSGQKINGNRFTDFLSKLSFYIYIWNWPVGTFIDTKAWFLPAPSQKMIFYYSVTFALSVISVFVYRKVKVFERID